ncbi:MAG: TorF family putative porin [Gemmatimonadota bacterium]|nr:TorF family putative porin [Gemmatimonadota bacterium]
MSARVVSSAVVAGFLVAAASATAQEDIAVSFSGSATLVNDYTFRGISQTGEAPAVQAGISAAIGSVYLGTWGSSLDFGSVDADDRATAEVDLFGGVATSLGGAADIDLGVFYYLYPGGGFDGYDFVEFALGVSRGVGNVSAGVSAAYSPDFFGDSGSAIYLGGSLGLDIPTAPLSLSASLGRQSIDDNDAFGTPDYVDYSIGASLSTMGLSLGAAAVGTNLDESDCFGGDPLCKTRIVLSLGMEL